MRRVIGMDIHRTFREVVFWEDGRLRPGGRMGMTRSGLEGFGRSLARSRGGTQSGWRGNTAASLASKTIVTGRGVAIGCQSPCQPAGGLSAVSAERLGEGPHP